MNKQRRKDIKNVVNELKYFIKHIEEYDNKSIEEKLEFIKEDIAFIKDDEYCAFDNLPESFQESERGDHMLECIDYLEDAYCYLDLDFEEYNINDVKNGINNCIDQLNNAAV